MADPYAVVGTLVMSALAALAASGDLRARLGLASRAETTSLDASPTCDTPAPDAPAFHDVAGAGTLVHANPPRTLPEDVERALLTRARQEVERGVRYESSYRLLSGYPDGDVPADRGACTDVVVRAYRAAGADLQVLVHDDVAGAPDVYHAPPDPNVDHRRITTLFTYLERHALSLPTDLRHDPDTFRPGDVVFFAWKRCYPKCPCLPEHVGIVSDRVGPRGLPLVLQNGGPVASESDGLDHGKIVGHFRYFPPR